jgi:hypothetical protein
VLSEFKDMLIACTDNLKGLQQAIKALFPETVSQLMHRSSNTQLTPFYSL